MAPGSMAAPPVVASAAPANDAITNNQVAGVDEGGIVKVVGDHLVILRRGRLFTVSTAGGALRPVHAIDAFPPGTLGRSSWYDEVLVSGDQVIVIGFSYDRGGTEINRFRVAPTAASASSTPTTSVQTITIPRGTTPRAWWGTPSSSTHRWTSSGTKKTESRRSRCFREYGAGRETRRPASRGSRRARNLYLSPAAGLARSRGRAAHGHAL
jgi:hypothetical protein